MRKPLLAANWKMNLSAKELESYRNDLLENLNTPLEELSHKIDIVLGVPNLFLAKASEVFAGTPIQISTQNIFWQDKGAFTGESSCSMAKEAGASFCIVGHSERRAIFSETDEMIRKKFSKCLKESLTPILCVGESKREREQGKTNSVLERQLVSCLNNLSSIKLFVIAYEPVWAIGTGLTASKEQAQDAHHCIRQWLKEKVNPEVSDKTQILYGGSMKPEVTKELMAQNDVDGGLVGGASLDPQKFAQMINLAI